LLFPALAHSLGVPGGPELKSVALIDYAVIAAYMALMLGIGVYAMRFNRGAADYFKGGNRIHWLAAGLSSFMSGFSAWTFTGAAGLAYQHGLVTVLLYVGNACTFLLGYFIFAVRWRRARISTVMEYLVERFDERTRQIFSWSTIFFQFFTGGSMLYGLALFVAPACGWPLSWTIVGSGAVILAYCVVGGLWAVVITDFLQAAILMPFTLVMGYAALSRVGGLSGLLTALPASMTSLRLPLPEFGWSYVVCWTVMTSFGYNTAAMAQRYFSVDDESSTRKVALLCFGLFLLGALIWFLPPLAMRVLQPDLTAVWPGLTNPHESSYALAALTFLPNGLIGIMLAAMFSATMSSISGLLNVHASIISRDIFPALFPARAGDSEKLTVGWMATLGVGLVITAVALVMAGSGASVFKYMVEFNTVMSLAYGPPALLGLVVRGTPRSSGLVSFVVGLVLGSYVTFWAHSGLVATVLIVVPASVLAFFLSRFLEADDAAHRTRREAFFKRLDTPVDVAGELGAVPDPTAEVFRFLSRSTGLVGLASLLVLFSAGPEDRGTVIGYVVITLALAAGLSFVRGGTPLAGAREAAR
jgi:solute:Na+ symporter, SSS family